MSKYLVIVESPAKAKTIKKYLGDEYKVDASMGHIRDLPESHLGVDVKNDFEPMYVIMTGKSKLIKSLKEDAAKAEKFISPPTLTGKGKLFHGILHMF
jgi:Toprim domain.